MWHCCGGDTARERGLGARPLLGGPSRASGLLMLRGRPSTGLQSPGCLKPRVHSAFFVQPPETGMAGGLRGLPPLGGWLERRSLRDSSLSRRFSLRAFLRSFFSFSFSLRSLSPLGAPPGRRNCRPLPSLSTSDPAASLAKSEQPTELASELSDASAQTVHVYESAYFACCAVMPTHSPWHQRRHPSHCTHTPSKDRLLS